MNRKWRLALRNCRVTLAQLLGMRFAVCCEPTSSKVKINVLSSCNIRHKVNVKYGPCHSSAVSSRLPTAAARVQFQVRLCGICSGQSGTGAGFLRVLRFPLPILVPPNAPYSSGKGTVALLVADVPSGLSVTPPHKIKKQKLMLSNKCKKMYFRLWMTRSSGKN
jgi:hypothetical protein